MDLDPLPEGASRRRSALNKASTPVRQLQEYTGVTAAEYGEPMTKWEYVTVPVLVHATKQILDTWGADGWELVQVVPGPNAQNLVAYLKRPVAE